MAGSKSGLLDAAIRGNLAAVVSLLDAGDDINQTGERGYSSLHFAVENGHLEVVRSLLSRGVNVNKRTDRGYTSLQVASWRGFTENIKLLLSYGAGVNCHDNDGYTSIQEAVQHRHIETMKLLLKWGADVNCVNKDGYTCLHHAARWGNNAIVQTLLDWNADINSRSFRGETSLHVAAQHGHNETIQLLLAQGADLHSCDKWGLTSLHFAVQRGLKDTVELLLCAGIDVNASTKEGKTALQQAFDGRHDVIIEMLIKHGADLALLGKDKASLLIKHGLTTREYVDQSWPHGFQEQCAISLPEKTAVKVVLIGQTEAGKTSLLQTVKNQRSTLTADGADGRTVGIKLNAIKVKIHQEIMCYVYDFGGQSVYYPLHQLFITPYSLFSLVIDLHKFYNSLEDPDEQCFDSDIRHFYQCICQRVFSAVFQIIGTKTDLLTEFQASRCCDTILERLHKLERGEIQRLKSRKRELLEALQSVRSDDSGHEKTHYRFQGLSSSDLKEKIAQVDNLLKHGSRPKLPEKVIRVSSKTYSGIDTWTVDVADLITKHKRLFPTLAVPDTWEKLSADIETNEENYSDTYSIAEFSTLCRKFHIKGKKAVKDAIKYLRLIGQLLHYENHHKLKDVVFIHPERILNGLSAIFSHEHSTDKFWEENEIMTNLTAPIKRIHKNNFLKYGITSKTVLRGFLLDKNIESNFDSMIELMFQLDLMFKLSYSKTNLDLPDEDNYFIPSLLIFADRSVIKELWVEDDHTPNEFIFSLDMNTASEPSGLYEKITTRINQHFKKRCDIPKCTAALCNEPGNTILLEMIKDTKEVENPRLRFRLRFPFGKHLGAANSVKVICGRVIDILSSYPSVIWDISMICPCCIGSGRPESEWKFIPAEISLFSRDKADVVTECEKCDVRYELVAGLPLSIEYISKYREMSLAKLEEVVCDKIEDDWRFLTRELFTSLDAADRVVERIEQNREVRRQTRGSGENYPAVREMLSAWHQTCADRATINHLVVAVTRVNRRDIITKAGFGFEEVLEAQRNSEKQRGSNEEAAMKQVILLTTANIGVKEWRFLYRRLDPDVTQKQTGNDCMIDCDVPEIREKVYTVLKTWRKKYASSATYTSLIKALTGIDRHDVAEHVERICGDLSVGLDCALQISGMPQSMSKAVEKWANQKSPSNEVFGCVVTRRHHRSKSDDVSL